MTYAMKLAAPLCLATLTTAQVAQAGSATGTMNVSGNVQGSCTVSAVALNFGAITPGSATDAEGSIGAACTTGTTYTITIDGGSSLVDTNRRLAEAESENYLEYIIAIDESWAVDSYIPANGALVSNAIAESSETVNYSVTKMRRCSCALSRARCAPSQTIRRSMAQASTWQLMPRTRRWRHRCLWHHKKRSGLS